jgi:Dna[CI] antecedent, DciA
MAAHHTGSGQFAAINALEAEPTMAQLAARIRLSQDLLNQVKKTCLPAGLKAHVVAGPIHDGEWCILVKSSAATAKLRNLLPDLEQTVEKLLGRKMTVRLKVMTTPK